MAVPIAILFLFFIIIHLSTEKPFSHKEVDRHGRNFVKSMFFKVLLSHLLKSCDNTSPLGWLLLKKKSVGKDVEKLEPLCTVGGNVN